MPEAATALKEPTGVDALADASPPPTNKSVISCTCSLCSSPTTFELDDDDDDERELTAEEKLALTNDPALAEKYEIFGAAVFDPYGEIWNEEETKLAIENTLKSSGCTWEELKAQAKAGRFESDDASCAWFFLSSHADYFE